MVKLTICFFQTVFSMHIDLNFSLIDSLRTAASYWENIFFCSDFPQSINFMVFENSDIS